MYVPAARTAPWPTSLFPTTTAAAARRLRSRVAEQVDVTGAVRSPCRGRVLESALLLALLDRIGHHTTARQRAERFLTGHLDSAMPLDRLLARVALRAGYQQPGDLLDQFLRRAPTFMTTRKRAMVHVVLALLGAVPEHPAHLDGSRTDDLHPWARVQTIAVNLILARYHGNGRHMRATTSSCCARHKLAARSGRTTC